MCLIALAWRALPDVELAVVANRDEFHARPAAPAAPGLLAPGVLAGRDLQAGGSWMAYHPGGRFAAVTNLRRAPPAPPAPRSRGELVADFVASSRRWAGYAERLAAQAAEYGRFTLLAYDGQSLHSAGNDPAWHDSVVAPGFHALSNASLDAPWPKAENARAALAAALQDRRPERDPLPGLLGSLADRRQPEDSALPDTGVGLETERFLAPMRIVGPHYGTRCTTALLRLRDGRWWFAERRYHQDGRISGESRWQGRDDGRLATSI